MATRPPPAEEPVVQLAARVPASLLQRVKIYCVQHDVKVMAFVAEAIEEKLRAVRRK